MKAILKDIWQEFLLTLKMFFWIAIFLSIFIPQSVDWWLP